MKIQKLSRCLIIFSISALSAISVFGQEFRGIAPGLVRYVQDGKVRETGLYDSSHALVIGMSKYEFWPQLKGPEQDVREVKDVLVEHGFDVSLKMDLKSDELKKTIEDFVKTYGLDGNKRILVYFAGHGHTLKSPDGRDVGYIVPIDAPSPDKDPLKFKQLALDFRTITGIAQTILTRHSLFVFDSCFSGHLTTRSDGDSVPPSISEFISKPVRQFITSGSADQKVNDQSTFRKFFVDGLHGAADLDHDAYITATELFNYLSKRVVDEMNRQQTPTYGKIEDANLLNGDMVFALRKKPGADNSEEKLFEEAKAENSVQGFLLFLNTQKSGKFTTQVYSLLTDAIAREKRESKSPVSATAVASSASAGTPTFRAPDLASSPFEFDTVTLDGSGAEIAKEKKKADSVDIDLGGSVKIRLVSVPTGTFKMGSGRENEGPMRTVDVQPFYMSIYEITKKQWEIVSRMQKVKMSLPRDPAPNVVGDNLPVVNIQWNAAMEFCDRLSQYTGYTFALPSESQWEYAARAGTDTPFAFGPKLKDNLANFNANTFSDSNVKGQFRNQLVPVGSFPVANKFGLFDMHGNAAEWVIDSWAPNYNNAPPDGLPRVTAGELKVIRGGNYALVGARVCSTCRSSSDIASDKIGFRIILKSFINQR